MNGDIKYRLIGRQEISEELKSSVSELGASLNNGDYQSLLFFPVRVALTCWDIMTGLTAKTLQNIDGGLG